ncbi:hypothetical protein ACQ143_06960 [Microbacterium sp. MC2]
MSATTYRSVHGALRRAHGPASGYACAAPDCDRQATDWALCGEPTRLGTVSPANDRAVVWSTEPRDYAPLCRRHHRMLDGGGDLTFCPAGHHRATFGTTNSGECRGCDRDRQRRRRASKTTPHRGDTGRPATTTEGGHS